MGPPFPKKNSEKIFSHTSTYLAQQKKAFYPAITIKYIELIKKSIFNIIYYSIFVRRFNKKAKKLNS